ncbi:hypothetical protein ACJRO7_030591 [Eucalyptus globulus]|uniref:Uncharacterized protein n=1 Tax=Eucalyptus globulus TaxID=34317 RepID=A0ABD3JE90_EUCGL
MKGAAEDSKEGEKVREKRSERKRREGGLQIGTEHKIVQGIYIQKEMETKFFLLHAATTCLPIVLALAAPRAVSSREQVPRRVVRPRCRLLAAAYTDKTSGRIPSSPGGISAASLIFAGFPVKSSSKGTTPPATLASSRQHLRLQHAQTSLATASA